MICLWMNSIEPTSSRASAVPRPSSFVSRLSSRAIITFCWLPPDSDPMLVSIPAFGIVLLHQISGGFVDHPLVLMIPDENGV